MEKFSIEINPVETAQVVSIKGSIGVMEVDQVDAALTRLANQKPMLVILELSGVSMMGSSAMGSLVGFRRDLAKHNGVVRMAGVSRLVLESFKRAMFDRLFKFDDSVQIALQG